MIVSWTVNSGNEGIHYFIVTYRKLSDGSDEHKINTTQTEIEITGLEPGVEYEFEVSVQSVVFHSTVLTIGKSWNINRKTVKKTTRGKEPCCFLSWLWI